MVLKRNKLWNVSILTFVIVSLIMGFSGWMIKEVYNASYGTYEMIRLTLPAELIFIVILNFVVWKFFGFKEVGFSKPLKTGLLWFSPIFFLLILNGFLQFVEMDFMNLNHEVQKQLKYILLVTALVGFNEELLFRGIILKGLITTNSNAKSIVISAIAFSLFHSVNYFSGEPLISVILQLVMAFIAGFFLACMRIKMNSIWPLMIWHALWDFSIFSASTLNLPTNPILILSPILQLVLGILILRSIQKQDFQKTLTSSK